jgi:hypothetical protein
MTGKFFLSVSGALSSILIMAAAMFAPVTGLAQTATLTMTASPAAGGTTTPTGSSTVVVGAATNISAAKTSNYNFSGWTAVPGANAVFGDPTSANTTVTLLGDATVTANFTPITWILTKGQPSNGTITFVPDGPSIIVNQGDATTITATPNTNYEFVRWSVVSGAASFTSATSASTTVYLLSNATITATFQNIRRNLTMAVSGTGTTTPPATSVTAVDQGTATNISATAGLYWTFSNWTASPSGNASFANPASASTTVTLSGDATVTAVFTQNACTLTMAVTPTATPAYGTTAPAAGTYTNSYHQGDSVSITATPNTVSYLLAGISFYKWEVTGATIASAASASTTATLTAAAATITAHFHYPATLTMGGAASDGQTSPAIGSTTSMNIYSTATFADTSEIQAISATPAANFTFTRWDSSGGAVVANSTATPTTAWLTSATGTVTAVFTRTQANLTMAVSPALGGFTWPLDGTTTSIDQGMPQSIFAWANFGYRFLRWNSTGNAVFGDISSASTTVTLSGASTVTAVFVADQCVMTMAKTGNGSTNPSVASSMTVDFNTVVNISATPASGYRFVNWVSSAGPLANANAASTTVTVMATGTTTANFTKSYKAADDFNYDGFSDILIRNLDGTVTMLFMDSLSQKSTAQLWADANRLPVGMGDFNGDGFCDILCRNISGNTVTVYLMNNNTVLSSANLPMPDANPDWRIMATGDLNGDGMCDIVLRQVSTGYVWGYLMNGTTVSSSLLLFDSDNNWTVAGCGDINGDGKADIIWYNTATGQAAGWLMNGLSILQTGLIGSPDLTATVAGVGDLNGDGKADLILYNSSTGAVTGWLLNSFTILSSGTIYNGSDPNWLVAGTGDLNGDGKCDILFRNNNTGVVSGWLMNGLSALSSGIVYSAAGTTQSVSGYSDLAAATLNISKTGSGTVTPSGVVSVTTQTATVITASPVSGYSLKSWTVTGNAALVQTGPLTVSVTVYSTPVSVTAAFTGNQYADFNGDGKSDILWYNASTGYGAGWLMSGLSTLNANLIAPYALSAGWVPVGKGDFNGDGKADVLWRNSSSGQLLIYFMNGLTVTSVAAVEQSSPLPSVWSIVGIGDFNGDGKSDLLWRQASTGEVMMYLMSSSQILSSMLIFNATPDWTVAGTGDFNADGNCDIVWWNTASATPAVWLMGGMTPISLGIISSGLSADYLPAATGDYNGDGKADIAWQSTSSGNVYVTLMNGLSVGSATAVAVGMGKTFLLKDYGDYNGDGISDMLWRNSSTGYVTMWLMNSDLTLKDQAVIYNADSNWAIVK